MCWGWMYGLLFAASPLHDPGDTCMFHRFQVSYHGVFVNRNRVLSRRAIARAIQSGRRPFFIKRGTSKGENARDHREGERASPLDLCMLALRSRVCGSTNTFDTCEIVYIHLRSRPNQVVRQETRVEWVTYARSFNASPIRFERYGKSRNGSIAPGSCTEGVAARHSASPLRRILTSVQGDL